MSDDREDVGGVAQCACVRPLLVPEDDFCRSCRGYVVPERADALRRATIEVAEHRHAAAPLQARPRGTVVDAAGRDVLLHRSGGDTLNETASAPTTPGAVNVGRMRSLFANVTPSQLAAIAAAVSQPASATLVHDVDCPAQLHDGPAMAPTPGCKACDYAASRLVRAGLTGAAQAEVTPLRKDARRVLSSRELHEAADMAEQGVPLPGTRAHELIQAAEREGDFTTAAAIRADIVKWAPKIRAAAIAKANEDTQAKADTVRDAVVNLGALDKAKQKRERKASARLRAQEANMRRGARDGGQ